MQEHVRIQLGRLRLGAGVLRASMTRGMHAQDGSPHDWTQYLLQQSLPSGRPFDGPSRDPEK
jgi:hypothetical protein